MFHVLIMRPRTSRLRHRNYKYFACLLLVSVIWTSATHAEEPLTVNNLVAQVLARNAGLASLRAAVTAAGATADTAGSLPDARVQAVVAPETIGGFRTPGANSRNTNVRFQVSQEFPWPGTLGLRAQAAEHEAEAADDNVQSLRLRLAALAQSAFAEWVYVHHALNINASNQALVDELRRLAENRYATGLTRQQDVLQAEVELQHLKHQAIKLRRAQRVVRAKINGLLNRSPVTPLPRPGALPAPRTLPDYAALKESALTQHPQLAQIKSRMAANKDREALAQKGFYPTIKVFGGYNSLWDADEKRWTVGAGISLPLDRSKYHARLDAARANTMRSKFELQDERAQLLSELEQARAAVQESADTVALYQHEFIPRTEENLSAARSEYGAGGGTFLDVMTAERLKLNAELELQRARADYSIALAQLQRWTGGKLPPVNP